MPATMTPEERLIAVATMTGMSQDELRDFLACTPDQQDVIVNGLKGMNWTQSKSEIQEIISILQPLVEIAGVVGGVAGAASAVVALSKLL